MFWRKHEEDETAKQRKAEANAALQKSVREYYELQELKPEVEATVKNQLRLQLDNHFAERIWLAYRGDY